VRRRMLLIMFSYQKHRLSLSKRRAQQYLAACLLVLPQAALWFTDKRAWNKAEIEPAEIEPAEIEPAEIEPAEIEPAEIELVEIELAEVEVVEPVFDGLTS
jgi:hypothetical protein